VPLEEDSHPKSELWYNVNRGLIELKDDANEESEGNGRTKELKEVMMTLLKRSNEHETQAQKLRQLAEELMDMALVQRTLSGMLSRQHVGRQGL
jgi:hypothetical protein